MPGVYEDPLDMIKQIKKQNEISEEPDQALIPREDEQTVNSSVLF